MARLLVGYDGSPPARRALEYAVVRAKASGDEVILLTAIPSSVAQSSLSKMMPAGLELPPEMGKTFEGNAQQRLDDLIVEHKATGVKLTAAVRSGEPAKVFEDAVKEFSASEIVIGHKSYETTDLKLGPIAERLVRHMPATVVVVR